VRKRLDLSTRTTGVTLFPPVRFAGPYIAYARHLSHFDEHRHDDDWMEVVVADPRPLRPRIVQKRYAASDEVLRQFRRDRTQPDHGSNAEAVVTDMALSKKGSVAWIECPAEEPSECWRGRDPLGLDNPEWRSVFRSARGDRARTKLDEGSRIRRRSLVLRGARLLWVTADRTRTATLR
jgi:hypothetical protein